MLDPFTWSLSIRLPVPIASDLILLKLTAGGALDLRDAAALLPAGCGLCALGWNRGRPSGATR